MTLLLKGFILMLCLFLPSITGFHIPKKLLQEVADKAPWSSQDDVNKKEYAVMFDAGSSGTRVKVYRFTRGNGPLTVDNFEQLDVPKPNKVKPGLSSFANNIGAIKEYLRPLLEAAKDIVPDDKESTTTLRLFATAGMRLLTDREKKAIIDELDNILTNKTTNTFSYKKGYSRVISGQDEALYDWITVNFLKGSFSGNNKGKTYGALDMGGASHQNAFKLAKLKMKYKLQQIVSLNIAGKPYNIFAKSYLGGGEAEARKIFATKVVEYLRRSSKSNVLYDPCYNYGLVRNVTLDDGSFEVRGLPNKEKCERLMKRFFFCNRCAYKNQPKLRGDFYSFGVFSYAFKATGAVTRDDELVPMEKINEGIKNACSKRSDQFDFNKDPLPNIRCFQMNYINALLKYGYRVDKNFKLYNAAKLEGFDVNWAIGAMLVSNKLV